MHYRTLGKTGLQVSEIGYGTWGIGKSGWTGADDQQFHVWSDEWVGQGDWLEAVQQLKQQGKIRFFGISILAIPLDSLPETALRFVLSNPAVATVIPGMRSVRNVERNCAVGDGCGLPAEQVRQLRAHRWLRNFYNNA